MNTTKDCRAVDSNTNCRAVDELHQSAVRNDCRAIENRRRAIINKQKDQRAVNENSHQRAVIENINNDDQSAIIREKIKTNNPKIKIHKDIQMRNEPEKPYSIPWRIALPDNMLTNLVRWHHLLTMHTEGTDRTYRTLSLRYYHPKLQNTCHKIIDFCDICKKMKQVSNNMACWHQRIQY